MTPNIAPQIARMLVVSGLAAIAANGQASPFKDANLEATVRKFLPDSKPGEPLTDARLAQLAIVTTPMPVGDLSGLEKCKKLTFLFVSGPIGDLSPLAQLTGLQTVTVKGGKIRDLGPLAGLTNLEYLDLSANQISDVKPLAGLTKLKSMQLSNNQIKDLSPLSGLTALESLQADGNQIADLKPLAGLKALSTVELRKNQITDIGPLAQLPAWRYLYLDQNKITDLSPLDAALHANKLSEGFGITRIVSLTGNPLSATAKSQQIPDLRKMLFDIVADK